MSHFGSNCLTRTLALGLFVVVCSLLLPGCGDPVIPREELGEIVEDLKTVPGAAEPYDFKDLPEGPSGPPLPD